MRHDIRKTGGVPHVTPAKARIKPKTCKQCKFFYTLHKSGICVSCRLAKKRGAVNPSQARKLQEQHYKRNPGGIEKARSELGNKYPTRADYMNNKVSFREFYTAVAKDAGISFAKSDILPKVKAALAAGDEHLNTIPLRTWDLRATNSITQNAITRALKLHGDYFSLAGGVSTLKVAAINAAEGTEIRKNPRSRVQRKQFRFFVKTGGTWTQVIPRKPPGTKAAARTRAVAIAKLFKKPVKVMT